MRLHKVVLENFGPYHGRHEINLRVTREAPVVLVHGENERGKTSLANALRWCLYKTVFESDGAKIKTYEFMNWEALNSGAYLMVVRLEFEHRGSEYVLERRVQATRRPSSDADLEFHETLRKDGHVQPAGGIERTIRDILPSHISKFFLFDGEMLNHFKVLLRDPSHNASVVKQSIEQILGVPALQRASIDLELLRRAAEQKQLQEARQRRSHERVIADAQQKQDQLDALERDIVHQKEIQQRLQREKELLRERRNQFAETQADLRRLDELDAAIAANLAEAERVRTEIREMLKDSWWMPLERLVTARFESAAAKARSDSARRIQRAELQTELAAIQKAQRAGTCTLCGRSIADTERETLQTAEAKVTAELGSLSTPAEAPDHLATVAQLRPFASQSNYRLLLEKDTHLRRLRIQAHAIEREMREIKDRVREESRTEIAEIEDQYDECVRQLSTASASLNDTIAQQRDTFAAVQRLQAQIRGLPDANRKLAAEAAVFAALKQIFDAATARFRDRLRSEVEHHATEVHRQLTTEPGYTRLKINDQYGLMLENEQGRDILRRSAGSEQIVALSLITALNKAADREGPVVMDTPLGRLDKGHRAKILKFADKLAPQVILLVQSGELDRERDLADLRPVLSHEYKIEREGASDRSRVVPLT